MADPIVPGETPPGDLPDNVHQLGGSEPEQEQFPSGVVDVGAPASKTLKTLIRSGLPVEMTVSMMSAEVPLRGGIPDPDGQTRLMITTELHKVEPVAQREDGKVTGWKIRAHLRPVYVEVVEAAQPTAVEG